MPARSATSRSIRGRALQLRRTGLPRDGGFGPRMVRNYRLSRADRRHGLPASLFSGQGRGRRRPGGLPKDRLLAGASHGHRYQHAQSREDPPRRGAAKAGKLLSEPAIEEARRRSHRISFAGLPHRTGRHGERRRTRGRGGLGPSQGEDARMTAGQRDFALNAPAGPELRSLTTLREKI